MWLDDCEEQRVADAAYERMYEARMKRDRSHGGSPPCSSGGSRSPGGSAKADREKRGVSVCMTCGCKYDVRFVDGLPKFYDHGTETPHRCKDEK